MAQKSISKGKAHESGDCKEYQNEKNATAPKQIEKENASEIYVSIICRMLDAYTDKSHLDVTWVSQSLYSGPLSNPDFFLSLIAGRIRQVVLYMYSNTQSKVVYIM